MKLNGRVAYVTGASRGIGSATAQALSRRGATVGLIARNGSDLDEVKSRLSLNSAAAVADVSDRDELNGAIDHLTDAIGPPDILVNNAGIGAYAAMLEESAETFERLMRVNYLGTVYATLAVLPGMAERRRGHIVNVASVAGRLGAPFEAAYSGSKFAVVGLSESLSAEMAPFGVEVSLVNTGPVATGFTDARGVPFQRKIPRPQKPSRIADAVLHAIESGRFEQTIPRWLRLGIVTRAVAPGLYRRGLIRDSAAESAELVQRTEEPTE